MNWDDLRIFLAAARANSFSAAALSLQVNQSTVSRRLAAMEQNLGTKLFERTSDGHILTAAGNELQALANNFEEDFNRVESAVTGRDQSLKGTLRITCVDMMVDRYLSPHLASFSAQHPDIEISLLSPMQPLDLMRREADIAIRVSDGPPETLIGRKLCPFAVAAYAENAFIKKLPENPDPEVFNWIGWESDSYNERMITKHFPTANIRHRGDSLLVINSLVHAGLGASVFPCYWADAEPGLTRVYPSPVVQHSHDLWILVHPDLRRTARVRAFVDFIGEIIKRDQHLFGGELQDR